MVTLGDRVWEDRNENGIQDPGEPGIAGFKVDLITVGGSVINSTFTNGSGEYFFNEQATQPSSIGGVSIRFDLNSWNVNNPTRRYQFTSPNQLDNPFTLLDPSEVRDSDADPTTGALFDGEQSSLVEVSNSFSSFNDIDAGLIPINNPPIARDDNYDVVSEQRTTLDVLSNDSDLDGDSLTITILNQPSGGGAFVSSNVIIYTSFSGFTGNDILTYRVSDGESFSDSATVRLNVTEPSNIPPVASDDTASTEFETAVTIDVLANDSDGDGDTLSIDSVGTPASGTVEIVNETVVYTPNAGFSGQDTFDYVIFDGTDTATASVTVTVENENNTPGVINGTENDDLLDGTTLEDTINGLGGNDTIRGLNRSDVLNGNDGDDTIAGNGGADLLNGDSGNDTLNGGGGNDTLNGGNDDDRLIANLGTDLVNGDDGNDVLISRNGDHTLNGGNGNDRLVSVTGNDILNGGEGNDTLLSRDGNDTLRGGLGDDTLRGGLGDNTFIIASGEGTDRIRDFVVGTDVIGLADGLTFTDLSFQGNRIASGGETLAILNGITTNTLNESDFAEV